MHFFPFVPTCVCLMLIAMFITTNTNKVSSLLHMGAGKMVQAVFSFVFLENCVVNTKKWPHHTEAPHKYTQNSTNFQNHNSKICEIYERLVHILYSAPLCC